MAEEGSGHSSGTGCCLGHVSWVSSSWTFQRTGPLGVWVDALTKPTSFKLCSTEARFSVLFKKCMRKIAQREHLFFFNLLFYMSQHCAVDSSWVI